MLKKPKVASEKKKVDLSKKNHTFEVKDGVIYYYDAETGEEIQSSVIEKRTIIDKTLEDAILYEIGNARSGIKDILAELEVPYGLYLQHKNASPHFKESVKYARKARSELVHESFFVNEVIPLAKTKTTDLNREGLKNLEDVLNVMGKKQKILSKYKGEEDPQNFGVLLGEKDHDKFIPQINLQMDVSQDALDVLLKKFTPVVSDEGEVGLPDINVEGRQVSRKDVVNTLVGQIKEENLDKKTQAREAREGELS